MRILIALLLSTLAVVAQPIHRSSLTTNDSLGTFLEGQVPIWNATMKKWTNGTAAGAGAPGAMTQTNFVINQIYTNSSTNAVLINSDVALTLGAAAGAAEMDLMYSYTGGTSYTAIARSAIGTSASTVVASFTNWIGAIVTNQGNYYFTNKSSGAGNSAAMVAGTGQSTIINGVGPVGPAGADGASGIASTNANQFGPSTTLTLKDSLVMTNATNFGTFTTKPVTGQSGNGVELQSTNGNDSFVVTPRGTVIISNNPTAGFFAIDKHATNSGVYDFGGLAHFYTSPEMDGLTASRVMVTDGSKVAASAATTSALLDNFFAMGISNIVAGANITISTNSGALSIAGGSGTDATNHVAEAFGSITLTNAAYLVTTNIGAATNITVDWSGPRYVICQPSNTATISFVSTPATFGQTLYIEMRLTNSTINVFWTRIDTRGRAPGLVQGVTNLYVIQGSTNTFVRDGQDIITGDVTAALVSSNGPSIYAPIIVNATVSRVAAFDAQGALTNVANAKLDNILGTGALTNASQFIASSGGNGTNLSLRPDPSSAASLVLKVLGVSTSTTNELEIQNNGVTYAAWNQYGQSLGTNHADNSPPMLLIRPITTGIQMDMITGTTLPINVKATNGGRFAVQADGSLEATTNASVYNLFVTNSGTFLGGGSNSLGFTTFTGSVTDVLAHLVLGTFLTTGQTNNGNFTNSTDLYNGGNLTNKGWVNIAGPQTNDAFVKFLGTTLANSNLWVQAGQSTSNAVVGGVVFKSYYATPYTNLNATISTLTNAAFWITPGNMMTNVNDGEIAVWRGGLKAGTNSLQVLFEKQVILSTGSISNSTCGFEIGYELTRINTTTLHADAWFSFQESSSGVLNVGDAGLIRTNFDFTVTGIGGAINTNLLQIASNEGIGVSNNWMKVTFEPASR